MTSSPLNARPTTDSRPRTDVGARVTVLSWNARHAVTVIAVSSSGSQITVQRDRLADANGRDLSTVSCGFVPDPDGAVEVFRLRRNGAWVREGERIMYGTRLRLDDRSEYFD